MPRALFACAACASFVAGSAHASVAQVGAAQGSHGATSSQALAENPEAEAQIEVRGEPPPRAASETSRDHRAVRAAPHRTAADVLAVVPGLFLTQHGGFGKAYQIFYRGFDAVHGQDLEITAGGVPVNDVSNIHGQGYADLHFLPPEVVARVRVKPGAYDPSQGDFAVAGSIALDLGFDEPGVTAKATTGSFGERRLFLAWHPADATPATFGAFEAWSTEGFGPSRAARRASALAQHLLSLGRGVDLRLLVTTSAARFDSAGVLRRDDLDAGRVDRFATYDPRQGGSSARSSLIAEISESREDGTRWSIAPFVILRSFGLRQNFTGFLADPRGGDGSQQTNEATTVGATAKLRRTISLISASDAIEVGIFLRHDRIEQAQRALSAIDDRVRATEVDAKIRATDAGGFVAIDLKPVRRVAVRGALRVDGLAYGVVDRAGGAEGQERTAIGTRVGPKLAIDARLISGLHAIASYGEGFRSPQARSLADGERTPFTTVRSIEAGLRHAEGTWLSGSIAAFRTALSDDLVFDPTLARNERVGPTTRLGIAGELVLSPAAWFLLSASATWTRATFARDDGENAKDDLVPYVPRFVLREDVAAFHDLGRLAGRRVRARVGTSLTGLLGRPLPFGATGSEIFLVDASIGARIGEPGEASIELSVDAFNLLDARWFDGQFVFASNFRRDAAPSVLPVEHVTVGAPRTVLATLTAIL
jgi:hypothetical protein